MIKIFFLIKTGISLQKTIKRQLEDCGPAVVGEVLLHVTINLIVMKKFL